MKKNNILITTFTAACIMLSAPVNAFSIKESFQRAKNAFYNKYIYSERYFIKKEESKLNKNLQTFILDKNAPAMMRPERNKYAIGDYEYSTTTWYNRGTWKAIVEVKFTDGPCVKIVKPVHFLNYTLLSKRVINTLRDVLKTNIKDAELENNSTHTLVKHENKEFDLVVLYPSSGQKVNNAVKRAVANNDWNDLKEILIMYKPNIYLTSMQTKPTEMYQIKNFDRLICHIVAGLKKEKFSYTRSARASCSPHDASVFMRPRLGSCDGTFTGLAGRATTPAEAETVAEAMRAVKR